MKLLKLALVLIVITSGNLANGMQMSPERFYIDIEISNHSEKPVSYWRYGPALSYYHQVVIPFSELKGPNFMLLGDSYLYTSQGEFEISIDRVKSTIEDISLTKVTAEKVGDSWKFKRIPLQKIPYQNNMDLLLLVNPDGSPKLVSRGTK